MLTIQKTSISCDAARRLVDAAIEYASARNLKIAVAVVDESAQLKAFAAMDGAVLAAVNAVQRKAQTALIGMGTYDLAKVLIPHPTTMLSMALLPGQTLLGGGEPIRIGAEIVGAIAVGGASAEEDAACAKAAIQAVIG